MANLRQYNIMEGMGNISPQDYNDFQDYQFDPIMQPRPGMQQPSPTFPNPGAIASIGASQNVTDPRTMGPQRELSLAELIQQNYQPETKATAAFDELLNNFPKRNNPGIARRLVASGMALKGGIPAAEGAMYAPYMRNKEDWMAQMDPRYKAASLERQSNANERQLATSIATASLNERKQSEVERKNQAEQKIRQQRADVYEFKARNPNLDFDFSGPTVMVTDPATGRVSNTGVPTGSMTEIDRINLQNKGRLEAARESGAQARKTEETRQEGRGDLVEKRGWAIFQQDGKTYRINPVTNEAEPVPIKEGTIQKPGTPPRPGSGGSSGDSELEKQRGVTNRASNLINTLPGASKWVKISNSGRVTVASPGRFTSDHDRALHARIIQEIYGTQPSSGPGGGRGGGPGPGRGNNPAQSGGGKEIVGKQYSASRNQTRITYADGTTKIVDGRQ